MTDEQRIVRYYACDDAAFAALYEGYFPQVVAFLRRMVHNLHAAEELADDVFLAVVQGKHGLHRPFDPGRGTAFRTWLFTIARNLAVDYFRRQGRRPTTSATISDGGPEASVIENVPDVHPSPEDLAILHDMLEQMPDVLREAILLVDMQGCTTKEAADILGIPQGTVGSRVYRARKWLHDGPGS